ncbi:response regulator [Sinorhizobium sp. CCBAU 05631]|uniref:response regulator n=1 Tax=Sinorhizobium sp. CCBAU 05631 TaxID=794846 RepID=UPI0005652927|nr:response regulator [Sinorhizobium sp. CCBAU 05631]
MPSDQISVLVVDDEFLLRYDLAMFLREQDFEVYEASTADEAIDLLTGHPGLRAVLTDVCMPGSMDGQELAARVHDRWPPIKIFVVSGRRKVTPEELPEGSRFIMKPLLLARVAAQIRTAVQPR